MKRVVAVALMTVFGVAGRVSASDDNHLWNKYTFKLPLAGKKLSLNGAFETRFREDMNEFFRYHFYIGPDYKPCKWLTLGMQYGNIQSGDPGDFTTEHRFMYFVTPKFSLSDLGMDACRLGPLTLTLQNRLDWRIRENRDHVHTWRYRIYPKLSYPLITTENYTISPYVGNACYFDFTDNTAFNQNRTYAGFSAKIHDHVSLNLYYMRLNTRSGSGGSWTGANIFGTGLGYEF